MIDETLNQLTQALTAGSTGFSAVLGVDVSFGEGQIVPAVGSGTAVAVPAAGAATHLVLQGSLATAVANRMSMSVEPAEVPPDEVSSFAAEALKELVAGAGRHTVTALGVELGKPAPAAEAPSTGVIVLAWPMTVGDVTGDLCWTFSLEAAVALGLSEPESTDQADTELEDSDEPLDPVSDIEVVDAELSVPSEVNTHEAAAPGGSPSPGLGRLAGVMLDVTVELGRTRLPLREVLALGEGGVVRLGRQADEPVDLFINGLSAARGEIVVVNGRLGLKVTELIG